MRNNDEYKTNKIGINKNMGYSFSCFIQYMAYWRLYIQQYRKGKESIQEDIQQLKQELYSIKPVQNYFVKDVALANRRAIIAKSLRANILPITTEYTSELTLYEFERYFIRNGWDIVEYRKRPSLHIKASNEKYVVTLDLISSMNDEWRIQIGYNNFFEKYNL